MKKTWSLLAILLVAFLSGYALTSPTNVWAAVVSEDDGYAPLDAYWNTPIGYPHIRQALDGHYAYTEDDIVQIGDVLAENHVGSALADDPDALYREICALIPKYSPMTETSGSLRSHVDDEAATQEDVGTTLASSSSNDSESREFATRDSRLSSSQQGSTASSPTSYPSFSSQTQSYQSAQTGPVATGPAIETGGNQIPNSQVLDGTTAENGDTSRKAPLSEAAPIGSSGNVSPETSSAPESGLPLISDVTSTIASNDVIRTGIIALPILVIALFGAFVFGQTEDYEPKSRILKKIFNWFRKRRRGWEGYMFDDELYESNPLKSGISIDDDQAVHNQAGKLRIDMSKANQTRL